MNLRTCIVLCSVMVANSACMTFEVEGAGALRPESDHGSEVVHGSLYKTAPWQSRAIEKCTDGSSLYRVEYYTNGLFVLASAATLGVYVPQSVEWWCQAPEADDSEEPPLEPSGGF